MMEWMLILRIWPKVTSRDENAGNTKLMKKWMPILRIWSKVTSRDENAGNTARFCVKVVNADPAGMKRLGTNAEFISQSEATS